MTVSDTYVVNRITYTEQADGRYVAADGSVLATVEHYSTYVIDQVEYTEQPDGTHRSIDGGLLTVTGTIGSYAIDGVVYTEQADGTYLGADGTKVTSVAVSETYVIDGVTYTEAADGTYVGNDGSTLSGTATNAVSPSTTTDAGAGSTQDVTGALDIQVISHSGSTVTFGIYANPTHDPGTVGIEAIDFTLSHMAADLTIDDTSITFASGVTGVPNYDAATGVMNAAAYSTTGFNTFSTPLVTFDAVVANSSTPIALTISNAVIDSVAQQGATESFDLSPNNSISTTMVDRFGNALAGAEAHVSETDWGDQIFVRELGPGLTGGTTYEIVANPTTELSALDFKLNDNVGLIDFQLSSALSTWTVQANTATPDQVIFGGFGATDGSTNLTAGQETVVASFTTTGQANFVVSGISMNGVGQTDIATNVLTPVSTTTSSMTYSISQGADCIVSADMAVDAASDQAIGAYDALQALRLAVGLTKSDGTAEWHDYIAADINTDGRVGADDALNILKFAVGLTDGPAADWVFVDSNADYSAISRQNTFYDEGIVVQNVLSNVSTNLTGILVGDVDGSFVM